MKRIWIGKVGSPQAVHRDENVSDEMKHRNANSVTHCPQISADHRNVHKVTYRHQGVDNRGAIKLTHCDQV